MSTWSVALAIGLSFTRPSDLTIEQPSHQNKVTFSHVRWAGQSFVSPLYYVVRINKGDIGLDFTHYKIIANVNEALPEKGEWHGQPVDDEVKLDQRVQHLEISHGVNSFALVGIVHDPTRRGAYIGFGPIIFMPHSESTVDGKVGEWGYANGGTGFEVFAGVGFPQPFAEVKHAIGHVKVGIADGTASVPLQTTQITVAP